MMKDIFLCHASEDKEEIVRPLFQAMIDANVSCWLDEAEIHWGDSITQKVNEGLSKSRYVIVVLSQAFLNKDWPQRELNALLNIEASTGEVKILPLLVGDQVAKEVIMRRFSLINDKRYLSWNGSTDPIIEALQNRLNKKVSKKIYSSDNDFFGQPNKLCNALNSQALQTKGWKPSNAIPGEFMCATLLVPFGLPSSRNGMENNISYYVNGTQADRANDISIKININNPNERGQAFDRLNTATKTLFKAIQEQMPIKLSEALAAQKPISLDTAFGKVELIHEPENIDTFKIILIDKHFLVSRQATKAIFADDFEACRLAVAKAADYSVSNITGDGQPINGSDHRSFLLDGRDNDIFFCEVYL